MLADRYGLFYSVFRTDVGKDTRPDFNIMSINQPLNELIRSMLSKKFSGEPKIMNAKTNSVSRLGDALFSITQKKVLGLLYGRPDQSFFVNQILRITGMGVHTKKRNWTE